MKTFEQFEGHWPAVGSQIAAPGLEDASMASELRAEADENAMESRAGVPASVRALILQGKAVLGIELGSTRIKACLIGTDSAPIAAGGAEWDNELVAGVWTYSLDAVWSGLRDCVPERIALARAEVAALHAELPRWGLVVWTAGDVSQRIAANPDGGPVSTTCW